MSWLAANGKGGPGPGNVQGLHLLHLSMELGSCFGPKIGQRARKLGTNHDLYNSSPAPSHLQLLTRHFLQSHFSILTFTA